MNLYEIDKQIQNLLDMQWEENLSDDDIKDTLDNLLLDRYDKCINIALAVKNVKKDIEKFKEEEKRLTGRRKSLDKKLLFLKQYLTYALHGEKINEPKVQVYYSSSDELIIDDTTALPENFLIPQEVRVDKEAIKKAIKDGNQINGAHIEKKEHIVVR